MKSKLILIGLLVVLVLSLLACQSEATPTTPTTPPTTPTTEEEEPVVSGWKEKEVVEERTIETVDPGTYRAATSVEFYTCNDFANEKHITDSFELSVGKGVTVMLCSNPSTGFQWAEEAQISDPTVIEQVSYKYVAPSGDKPGEPGTTKFNFRALKTGVATVYMEYNRDWEGGEKAEWTCTLTIHTE